MKNALFSKKIYFILVIIILAFWIINSFIPQNSCHEERYGAFHWSVCDNMTTAENILFIIFNCITLLGSAYLIIVALLFLQQKHRKP